MQLATLKLAVELWVVVLCVAACSSPPDTTSVETDAQRPADAGLDASSVVPYVAKFNPPDGVGPDHYFGDRVALDGDTAVVGATARGDDWPGTETGAAYVYRRIGGIWEYEATLLADDRQLLDRFGNVAISGDRVLVGTLAKDAAYVFRRDGQTWTQEYMFVAPDALGGAGSGIGFGNEVDLSADTVMIGASQADGAGEGSGAVYVWRLHEEGWTFEQKVFPDTVALGFWFGSAVAISGDTMVVGGGTTVNVYIRSDASWTLQTELVVDGLEEDERLGIGVAIEGDTIVATATREGGTFVFERDSQTWSMQQHLADVRADGEMVSLALPRLLLRSSIFERIGSHWEQVGTLKADPELGVISSALGTNSAIVGDPHSADKGGAAYVYDL